MTTKPRVVLQQRKESISFWDLLTFHVMEKVRVDGASEEGVGLAGFKREDKGLIQ